MKRSLLALGLVGAVSCGAAPQPAPIEDEVVTGAVEPGIALSIDFRGRRIDVAADGVLNAEGCGAARYDWARHALLDLDGREIGVATDVELPVDGRGITSGAGLSIEAPDHTPLATITNREAYFGTTPMLEMTPEGAIVDHGVSAPPVSTNVPVPETHWTSVLGLLTLVGVCWETHPRAIPER